MQELLRTGIYFCKLEVNLPIHLGAATGLFILIGMMIGILIAKKYMEITSIALLFGIINCLIQWLILILFGGLSIHRYVRKNIMELRKQS